VQSGDWNAVKEFIEHRPGSTGLKITNSGGRALHFAVQAKQEHIVEKLVKIMSKQELTITNNYGDTALSYALYYSKKLARYLYSCTPEEDRKPEKDKNGATLCFKAIYSRNLGNNSWSNYMLAYYFGLYFKIFSIYIYFTLFFSCIQHHRYYFGFN
jgi:hypothetical protein